MLNKFAGTCYRCGVKVEKDCGIRTGIDGKWRTVHKSGECIEKTVEEQSPSKTLIDKLFRIEELYGRDSDR